MEVVRDTLTLFWVKQRVGHMHLDAWYNSVDIYWSWIGITIHSITAYIKYYIMNIFVDPWTDRSPPDPWGFWYTWDLFHP